MKYQGKGYQCVNCTSLSIPLGPKETVADEARGTVKITDWSCPLCECEEFTPKAVFMEI